MNIWQFQNKISKRLIRWSILSIVSGFLFRFGNKFWRNVGNQFIAWGAIDALIAIFGQMASRNRIDSYENPGKADIQQQEAKNLKRILLINAVLDVFYIIGGLMWTKRDKGDGRASGNAFGVIVQGLFLLVFDMVHALKMPEKKDD